MLLCDTSIRSRALSRRFEQVKRTRPSSNGRSGSLKISMQKVAVGVRADGRERSITSPRHGDVVNALHAWRSSSALPNHGRLVKNVLIDMGVAVGRDLVEVFEVKTSTSRSDVYAAIGQLMVHGTADDCRRVIVLPHKESIATDLKNALDRLGIQLLNFKLDEEKAIIV